MIYDYTPVVKNQKNNPFYRMRSRDKEHLKKELEDRLLWLCQLGASKDETDRIVYGLIFNTADKKDFGASPKYNNASNTGAAALSGAIEKLRTGDLSEKQVNNIKLVIEACHKAYPHIWAPIEFQEKNSADITVDINQLFDYE